MPLPIFSIFFLFLSHPWSFPTTHGRQFEVGPRNRRSKDRYLRFKAGPGIYVEAPSIVPPSPIIVYQTPGAVGLQEAEPQLGRAKSIVAPAEVDQNKYDPSKEVPTPGLMGPAPSSGPSYYLTIQRFWWPWSKLSTVWRATFESLSTAYTGGYVYFPVCGGLQSY
jgi:hypothetical protein